MLIDKAGGIIHLIVYNEVKVLKLQISPGSSSKHRSWSYFFGIMRGAFLISELFCFGHLDGDKKERIKRSMVQSP